MKKVFAVALLLTISALSHGQKQFTSKQEALSWLKEAFAKYFVKSAVNETENKKIVGVIESSANQFFDYEFTDTYLLISRKNKNFQMPNWIVLLPFDKINRITTVTSSEYAYYKQATHVLVKSNCNCFKYIEGKTFKGEGKFDNLQDRAQFPFNLNEEKDISQSLQNAFTVLSGNGVTKNESEETKSGINENSTTEKYTMTDVLKWKKYMLI
jgi:hypothetical protein